MKTIITFHKHYVNTIDSDDVFKWLRNNIIPDRYWPDTSPISPRVADHEILATAIMKGYSFNNIVEPETTTNNQNNQNEQDND